LQQYAREARKEYTELGNKDLTGLKTFVKGLPKLLLLDTLSDLAAPVAEVVKEQVGMEKRAMSAPVRTVIGVVVLALPAAGTSGAVESAGGGPEDVSV
jgi:hypothetical protein